MTNVNKEQVYAAVRYQKSGRCKIILKNNLTIEEARNFCKDSPTRKKNNGAFVSFVGFTHMSNL